MNILPFSDRTVRMPIWGLGCAGGAGGVSRAYDYCKAHPKAKVLVVCVELCSLTFQKDDYSKSNLVGTSLFADGAACVLVCGDEAELQQDKPMPYIHGSASKWMPESEDVMGWDVKNSGLHVVFSKSIPSIISKWLGPFIHEFLGEHDLSAEQIENFVAHPGGKKYSPPTKKPCSYGKARRMCRATFYGKTAICPHLLFSMYSSSLC